MTKRIDLPLADAAVAGLSAGDEVALHGILYVARDAAHRRFMEALAAGRTAVWHENRLLGRQEFLRPLFDACITVSPPQAETINARANTERSPRTRTPFRIPTPFLSTSNHRASIPENRRIAKNRSRQNNR